jgi:hydrogenase-4 membrane subunit HyfE
MISPNTQLILNVLAGAMFVLAFFIIGKIRLRSMLNMLTWQSILLALFVFVIAWTEGEWQLFITATLIIVMKAWLIPKLLLYSSEHTKASQRLQSFLRPETTLFLGFIFVIVGFILTRSIVPGLDAIYPSVGVAVSMILLGLLSLIVRKDMYGQIVAFLLMENGIFVFGLTLTGGMPLLVELGIFLDVTIGAVLMAGLSYRVQQEIETVTTDALSELID